MPGYFEHMLKTVDEQAPLPLATAAPLYARVLGGRAGTLHPQVAAVHCQTDKVEAQGWMRVERGTGWWCRVVAAVAGLPRRGARLRTWVEITPRRGEEHWIRWFGDAAPFRSRQSAGPPGELVERFGPMALVFRLDTDGDVLHFRQIACEVRFGRFCLPVPAPFAPRVAAAVGPAPDSGVAVAVRVDSCWTGVLLAYEGTVALAQRSV